MQVSDLLSFLDQSPSPYHAVAQCTVRLEAAGFVRLFENASPAMWRSMLQRGGRYFVTRNGSSLLAFCIGNAFDALGGTSAIKIVAAHTDSPCLRLKPLSARDPKEGLMQVAVQTYGGGLWHTWFDRDLSIAGRIVVRDGQNGISPSLRNTLVKVDDPILRIPNLAIHLDRNVSQNGFQPNTETHTRPIYASAEACRAECPINSTDPLSCHLVEPALLRRICDASGAVFDSVLSFDLCLYDTQPAAIGGIYGEFLHSARLDNLFMSYCALSAFLQSTSQINDLTKRHDLDMLALFDHEEVGSASPPGAESTLMRSVVRRIIAALCHESALPCDAYVAEESLFSRSFLVSADMAHAAHPNYPEKHEDGHRPRLGHGVVIKHNSNQRYATSGQTAAAFKAILIQAGCPVQEYCVRNDSPCGSTIGPILASSLGIQTIDIGAPQLAMHSIRETASTRDVGHTIAALSAFFNMVSVASVLSE